MESRRRSWAWALVVLLPVVAGLGWWAGRASLPAPDRAADADTPVDATPVVGPLPTPPTTDGDVARPPSPDAPLPDLALPLRDTWQGLKQRADSGDAKASCRLAAELEYCDQIRQRLDAASAMLADHEAMASLTGRSNPEAAAQERARRQALTNASEDVLGLSRHCEGVPSFPSQDRVRYWRSAALGGSVAAMRHYTVGNAFRLNDTLENLDELRLYRNDAEMIAKRAVAAGDLPTTLALAAAYSPQPRNGRRFYLAQVVKPDPVQALALYLHVQDRLRDGPPLTQPAQARMETTLRDLESGLSPASRSQARAQAARYAVNTPVLPSDRGNAFNSPVVGATTGIDRQDCDPPR